MKFGVVKNEKGEFRSSWSHATYSTLSTVRSERVRKRRFINTTAIMPTTSTRWPRRWPVRCNATSTTPGREKTIRAPWLRRCFPTACRRRSTTISSRRSIATCPQSIATTMCAAGRCRLPEIHHYDTYPPILADRKTRHPGIRPSRRSLRPWPPSAPTIAAALEGPPRPLVRSL